MKSILLRPVPSNALAAFPSNALAAFPCLFRSDDSSCQRLAEFPAPLSWELGPSRPLPILQQSSQTFSPESVYNFTQL